MAMKGLAAAGVTVTAASVAALGAYLLYGRNGLRRRHKIRGWMLRMRADILDQLEGIRDLTQERYNQVVDQVADKYGRAEKIGHREMERINDELKRAWHEVRAELAA